MSKVKQILIIEHRSFVRYHLRKEFDQYNDYEIIAVAKDLSRGYELTIDLKPDIIIMDGRMLVGEDRCLACKMVRMHPVQIIALADELVYDELIKLNEVEQCIHNLILLDKDRITESLLDIVGSALRHDRMIKDIEISHYKLLEDTYTKAGETVIAIGASTGGVAAIEEILLSINGKMPPILMVQHMSKTFTGKMAERLSKISGVVVKEAEDGEIVRNGVAYLAPGDQHMTIESYKGKYRILLDFGPLVHYQRPAVENLFESVAGEVGPDAIGVLLTGMGKDGAKGLLRMKEEGAYTIAQNAASSVVFGMPKAAIDIGGACEVAPLNRIPEKLMELSSYVGLTENIADAV